MAGKVTAGLVKSNGFMTMHLSRCGPGDRWWQPITVFMDIHAATCRLTAEYGISSFPQHLSMGLYLTIKEGNREFSAENRQLVSLHWKSAAQCG